MSIAESWAQWDEIVLGPNKSSGERRDLRYAFFCGAMAFSSLLRDAAESTEGDPHALKVEITKLTRELNDFYGELVTAAHARAN